MEDLRKSLNQISKMYGDAMRALEQGEPEEPEKLIRRREKVMDLDINMRKAHMDRVNKGKCKAKLSAPFTRLLHWCGPYGKQLCESCRYGHGTHELWIFSGYGG